ncbi:glutamate receptor 2.9, partial [Neltuma alba]|uniref:glutamate receptor 2.9 n=1 Tax=Neltuma alba TaxID=207710 RepID=UPI0010A2E717
VEFLKNGNSKRETTAKPSPWRDVQEIRRNNQSVGYQNNSWVKELLIHQIGFDPTRLKPLESPEQYKEALSNEDKEKGIVAIFDETPYLMLMLSQCPSCKMTGPIYKTAGFAFAFPKNSTLVSKFSVAILKVTQNVVMFGDMMKSISLNTTIDKSEFKSGVETRSLTIEDFGALSPVACVLALFFGLSILKPQWLQKKWISCWTVRGGGVIY